MGEFVLQCVMLDLEGRVSILAHGITQLVVSEEVHNPQDFEYLFDRAVTEARDLLMSVLQEA